MDELPPDVPDGNIEEGEPRMILGREPAAIAAVIAIAINLFISFGLKLSVEQVALINALVVAVLGLIVRQAVTPTANPQLPIGTPVNDGKASVKP